MLAIGRALMARPKLMLLDEPSLGLSPILVKEIFGIIRRLNQEQNVTMLLVEQNANMASRRRTMAMCWRSGASCWKANAPSSSRTRTCASSISAKETAVRQEALEAHQALAVTVARAWR